MDRRAHWYITFPELRENIVNEYAEGDTIRIASSETASGNNEHGVIKKFYPTYILVTLDDGMEESFTYHAAYVAFSHSV